MIYHIPADDLRIGDVILHDDGRTTVRELDRSHAPTIITNPGAADQITGNVWEHVAVQRDDSV